MTRTQQKTLAFIVDYRREHGISPSHREIAAFLGVSQPRVTHLITALAGHNRVVRTGRHERNIEIVGPALAQASDAEVIAEMIRRGLNKGAQS